MMGGVNLLAALAVAFCMSGWSPRVGAASTLPAGLGMNGILRGQQRYVKLIDVLKEHSSSTVSG